MGRLYAHNTKRCPLPDGQCWLLMDLSLGSSHFFPSFGSWWNRNWMLSTDVYSDLVWLGWGGGSYFM